MDFSKYEATGNDFIMLNGMLREPYLSPQTVTSLCDRRTGIGADGVIVMLPSEDLDVRMRILNCDGTEAEMCGNGIRALFLFAMDRGTIQGSELRVETLAGPRAVRLAGEKNGLRLFSADMGLPEYTRSCIPMVGAPDENTVGVMVPFDSGITMTATCVSMGNPHCVIFVPNIDNYSVSRVGPLIENHPFFPRKTNVEFVEIQGRDRIKARVWERGVGETMACGTGACASLVAASLNDLTGRKATVSLPGGDLEVEWENDGVTLTGPARRVFDGKTTDEP